MPELFFLVIGVRDGRAQTGVTQATSWLELQVVREDAGEYVIDPNMVGRTLQVEVPFTSEVQGMYRKVFSTNGPLTEVAEA